MQSREKQIEEMQTVINGALFADFRNGHSVCIKTISEYLYNAGYRKASEVAREIFESIEECIYLYYNKNDYTMPNIEEDIAELKKKYAEGI